MSSREFILERVRRNQPAPRPLPDGADLRPAALPDPLAAFAAALARMGGTRRRGAERRARWTRSSARAFPTARVICSATPEVAGTRGIESVRHPAELDDVDVGVVRAVFGVAETGSVWLSEREFVRQRARLPVAAPRRAARPAAPSCRTCITRTAHRGFFDARYAVLMTGPSATADIEGVLIRGAQGIRTLTVIPAARPPPTPPAQREENPMIWQQVYDPFGSMVVSTTLAAVPVVVMLVGLGFLHLKAHVAAGLGLVAALAIAIFAYGMPAEMAGKAAMLGGFTGLLPIGWIVLNIIFLHQLADKSGACKIQEDSIANITQDRRLQLLLIAFSYGAFFEGAAGFGTPVAVTAAILIGLGFSPLAASGLSLIANTAPVAYGALGTPIITMAKVHGYDVMELSAMVGRQLAVLLAAGAVLADLGVRGPQGE